MLLFLLCMVLLALPPVRRQVEQRLYPRKYNDLVEQYAAEYDLDPLLVYSFIRTESGFDPGATSQCRCARPDADDGGDLPLAPQ